MLRGMLRRIQEAEAKLDAPGPHLVGLREPAAYTRFFGPIPLTKPADRSGEETEPYPSTAVLVDPAAYLTPNFPGTGNVIVGNNQNFWWVDTHVASYVSWTYTSNPDAGTYTIPVDPAPFAGLFDPAIAQNGGAVMLNNFATTPQYGITGGVGDRAARRPRLCFDIDLYDLTRGRSITDGRIGAESFVGGMYGPKVNPRIGLWEHGTEIEPRVYVTECSMSDVLNEDDIAEVASVGVWLSITFTGHTVRV
jgi:hypothetical protein